MKADPLMCELSAKNVHASFNSYTVERWREHKLVQAIDQVAEEVPVAMIYNGISHVVMLATPEDLEQFGLGFSLTEGILHSASELYDLEVVQRSEGIELQMTIPQQRFAALKQQRRNLAGRTGCGLCGAESLQQVRRKVKAITSQQQFSTDAIHRALSQLPMIQTLQRLTGAVHAAAWVEIDGSIAHLTEDVGRHNALDKLIGTLATSDVNLSAGFALVTSRASYEMVQKTATMGISMLVAVSGPTGLAIGLAQEAGLTLVGFARNGGHIMYTHSQRLIDQ